MKYSVKKGDNVLVLTGKDAGKMGEVLEINHETNRVKVAGVNIQSHHQKPKNKDDKGGIMKSEGAIDISNVQVVCPVCKKATRVARKLVDGKHIRVCKKCGESLEVVGKKPVKAAGKPAKKETAKKDAAEKETKSSVKEKTSTAKTKSTTKETAAKTAETKTSTAKTAAKKDTAEKSTTKKTATGSKKA